MSMYNAPATSYQTQGTRTYGAAPSNHKVLAWISIIGVWPLAIAAIINANKVDSRWAAGDKEGARRASTWALGCSLASFGLTLLLLIAMAGA